MAASDPLGGHIVPILPWGSRPGSPWRDGSSGLARFELVDTARALLVLGSSLTVMSGLRFVRRAAKAGLPVAILNHGPTRGDEHASIRVDLPLAHALTTLARNLDPNPVAPPTSEQRLLPD
jgi:hypothetical protein